MSAAHNHPPVCCCPDPDGEFGIPSVCPACPEHGDLVIPVNEALCGFRALMRDDMPMCTYPPHPITERHSWQPATPYTEQETTDG